MLQRINASNKSDVPSKSAKNENGNVNYISIAMKRFKELSAPVLALLNSLNPSQRRMALIAVGIIFFWPLLLLALNLPWMLSVGAVAYASFFGTQKFYLDANEAAKDHLNLDVEAKARAAQIKFQQSQFPGKDLLIYSAQRAREFALLAYKTALLVSMKVLDYLVTVLLSAARTAKNLANKQQTQN